MARNASYKALTVHGKHTGVGEEGILILPFSLLTNETSRNTHMFKLPALLHGCEVSHTPTAGKNKKIKVRGQDAFGTQVLQVDDLKAVRSYCRRCL